MIFHGFATRRWGGCSTWNFPTAIIFIGRNWTWIWIWSASSTRKNFRWSRERRGSHNFHRAFRQRVEKGLAVLLRQHAIIQHHDDARVGLRADQSADALAKFQNRLRQGKFAEGISATRFNRLDARLDERMVGHGERQPRDDDVAQRLARHVHALPETVRAEQHGVHVVL